LTNKNRAKLGFKKLRAAQLFCEIFFAPAAKSFSISRQPRNLKNVTLGARLSEHFRGFWASFFVAELPQKKGCFIRQEFTHFLSDGGV